MGLRRRGVADADWILWIAWPAGGRSPMIAVRGTLTEAREVRSAWYAFMRDHGLRVGYGHYLIKIRAAGTPESWEGWLRGRTEDDMDTREPDPDDVARREELIAELEALEARLERERELEDDDAVELEKEIVALEYRAGEHVVAVERGTGSAEGRYRLSGRETIGGNTLTFYAETMDEVDRKAAKMLVEIERADRRRRDAALALKRNLEGL